MGRLIGIAGDQRLLAAMLTAQPAWSSIDPLMVVLRETGERVDYRGDQQLTVQLLS